MLLLLFCEWLESCVLIMHFYIQITLHNKNASLLDSCPSPLLQIPHIHNDKGINFDYVLSSMYPIIILVKLCTHMQTIYILKQGIMLCMHTKVHTHTCTHIHARIMSCHVNYSKNHIHFHDLESFNAWPYFPIFTPKESEQNSLNSSSTKVILFLQFLYFSHMVLPIMP
jgi:hypothetical protein